MRISPSCAVCLYDKQAHLSDDPVYLGKIKDMLDNRSPEDTTPYMVYRFGLLFEERFGKQPSYEKVKKQYNDLVISMENGLRKKIEEAADPVKMSLVYARIGNYIDFGALNDVNEETFLSLFDDIQLNEAELKTMDSFLEQCQKAKSFLLITDNCGEIVCDKLFVEQLHKRFPELHIHVMVRGGEALNDATLKDALYIGMDQVAELCSNGKALAGTIYEFLSEEAKQVLDTSDVILAKGQANYESLSGQGRHIFYSFLCKCDYFVRKFNVPKLSGMFIEE